MRQKLRRLDETFLDLAIGNILCGVVSIILGMLLTKGSLWYVLGGIIGCIVALGLLIHMTVTIKRSVEMEPAAAKSYMTKQAILRYIVTLVVMYVGIHGSFLCFLGIVIGCLGSKGAAIFHRQIHENITRRILGY